MVAWYTAQAHANVAKVLGDSGIKTVNTGALADVDIAISARFDTITGVNLTDATTGKTKVIDQNGDPQDVTGQNNLVKSKLITFDFNPALSSVKKGAPGYSTQATIDDLAALPANNQTGETYYVSAVATGKIRIATARSGGDATGSAGADNHYVGSYTPSTPVFVGVITVRKGTNSDSAALAYTYDDVDTITGGSTKLGFYYSVSPLVTDGVEEADDTEITAGDDTSNKVYGTISFLISKTDPRVP